MNKISNQGSGEKRANRRVLKFCIEQTEEKYQKSTQKSLKVFGQIHNYACTEWNMVMLEEKVANRGLWAKWTNYGSHFSDNW